MGTKASVIEQTIQLHHQSASPMLRDTNLLERNIRIHGLRGNLVGGLESAAQEHHAALAPTQVFAVHDRLQQIEIEIKAAAAAGDTEKIQALMREREQVEQDEARRQDAAMAPFRRLMDGQPSAGEEKDLERRVKKLETLTAKRQKRLDGLRARLVKDPENIGLHTRIQTATDDLADIQPLFDEILARQSQIAEYKAWVASREDIGKAEAETAAAAKEREKDELSMTILANKMVKDYLSVRASMEQFNTIAVRRMTAAGVRLHWNLLDDLRLRINKETGGACVKQAGVMGAWTISDRIHPEVKP